MLHAFFRKKSSAYKRYLGQRDSSEPRVSSEDEIASLIFGPLDLLPAADNWTLWMSLLQGHETTAVSGPLPSSFFASSFQPISCSIKFWSRRGRIEPDILVEFHDDLGNPRSILVELKWGSGISGPDQLEKQWDQYQIGQHETSLHVFLAKHMGELPDDRQIWAEKDAPRSGCYRLRALRWHEFQSEIAKFSGLRGISTPLKRWSSLAGNFLSLVGIHPFVGFHSTSRKADSLACESLEKIAFWNAPRSSRGALSS